MQKISTLRATIFLGPLFLVIMYFVVIILCLSCTFVNSDGDHDDDNMVEQSKA